MKGHLYKKVQPEGWYVVYSLDSFTKSELRLHPDDLDSELVRWAENGSLNDKEVEFEIVKKFMADETLWYAKLIKASEYPELEGTNALCEDIINKREAPYISDDFQIGPDGAYEHTEEDERDWDVTLMDGLEDEDDIIPPTEELIESHKRYVELMKHIHEEQWEMIYNSYKGVSDLHDFFDWIKANYYPPSKKPRI